MLSVGVIDVKDDEEADEERESEPREAKICEAEEGAMFAFGGEVGAGVLAGTGVAAGELGVGRVDEGEGGGC